MAIVTGNVILAADVVLGSNMPSGAIIIWHGTIGSIPAGWLICDGNSGTPNLLTKFLQGVATAGTNPGTTGGSATHVLSEAELASHVHTVGTWTASASGTQHATKISQSNNSTNSQTPPTSSVGSDSAHENEPTFYDVAFLMKS